MSGRTPRLSNGRPRQYQSSAPLLTRLGSVNRRLTLCVKPVQKPGTKVQFGSTPAVQSWLRKRLLSARLLRLNARQMRLGWHLADCCRDRNQVVVARRYVEISPSTARDRYIRLRVMGTTISSRCLPARWPLLRYPQRGDWRISVRELAAEAVPEEKTPGGGPASAHARGRNRVRYTNKCSATCGR